MNRRSVLALLVSGGVLLAAALYWSKRWRYITIHHSGGNYGDVELLRRVHRERQPETGSTKFPIIF